MNHPDDRGSTSKGWDGTWPLRLREAALLVAAYVGVTAVGIVIGLWLTDWSAPNDLTRLDHRAADGFVDSRTSFLTDLVPWAAFPADTFPKTVISAAICGLFLWLWRRWYEAVYVAAALVFEALSFVTITHFVNRPRPDVERLLDSTINSSFPSGHVAAATVYGTIAVIVFRHTRNVTARTVAAVVVLLIPVMVAWARLYQGMHFVTDVVAGIVLGVVSVLFIDRVLQRHAPPPAATAGSSGSGAASERSPDRPRPAIRPEQSVPTDTVRPHDTSVP